MANLTELEILKDTVRRLQDAGFDYMLTGSLAMNYYAQPRMTRDIDIVVAIDSTNASRVIEIFGDDYYVSTDAISTAVEHTGMFNLVHLESVVKIDIIVRKRDKYRQLEFSRRSQVKLLDFTVWIVSKEDLILSKLNWASESLSEMQLNDVKNLLATVPDLQYLRQWSKELGVQKLLEQCLGE